MRRGIVKPI